MNVKEVYLSRKFSLGNYEMLECGFTATLNEGELPLAVLKQLEDVAEMYLVQRLNGRTKETRKEPEWKADKEQIMTVRQSIEKHKQEKSVLDSFPVSYRELLTLKDGKIYCKYVSKETWTEINQVAIGLGYEYVGGKGSHWAKKR